MFPRLTALLYVLTGCRSIKSGSYIKWDKSFISFLTGGDRSSAHNKRILHKYDTLEKEPFEYKIRNNRSSFGDRIINNLYNTLTPKQCPTRVKSSNLSVYGQDVGPPTTRHYIVIWHRPQYFDVRTHTKGTTVNGTKRPMSGIEVGLWHEVYKPQPVLFWLVLRYRLCSSDEVLILKYRVKES